MRPSTFPNLLSSINSNLSRLYTSGKLFEVGPNFHGLNDNQQIMVASGIQYGTNNTTSWNNEIRFTDIYDVKSDVFYVLEQLNVIKMERVKSNRIVLERRRSSKQTVSEDTNGEVKKNDVDDDSLLLKSVPSTNKKIVPLGRPKTTTNVVSPSAESDFSFN